MAKRVGPVFLLLILVGCGKSASERIPKITEEFVYGALAFSPSNATATGLHEYQGAKLDELLDDVSAASLDKQRRFYEKYRDLLATIKTDQLTPEEKADYDIIQNQTALALLDLNDIHSEQHAPQAYVEALGNALFSELVLEYAPKPQRIRHIMARLKQVPLYLDTAATNLVSAPSVWTQVAIEESQGNINLVDREIRAAVPAEMAQEYDKAARTALAAMGKFETFLRTSLTNRENFDWRLKSKYRQKFRLALAAGVEADDILQAAERQVGTVRARMLELARPLHASLFPGHKEHAELAENDRINTTVGEVLNEIAKKHSTRESYMDDARKDLEEARAFVQQKHLLTLPGRTNLQVIPTPEFMRGIYSVGGFNPAPALEPQLGAFYWVTPIPPDWPAERVESKLREYNFYKLKLLTVHEAMPGHYVQIEVANDVEPKARRLLRSVYGNGPYVEGWAQYATQAMLEEGFLDHSPQLALTFAKEELRVVGNTILDVRLQMLDMTDAEAMELMTKQTFQEKEEASGKLQRAKLSSGQLPMYYVGWRGWSKTRDEYKQKKGGAFNLAEFHDAALKEGAVPIGRLSGLLK